MCVGACNVLLLNSMVEAVPYSHTLCFWVSYLLFHGDIRAINQNLWLQPIFLKKKKKKKKKFHILHFFFS